MSKLLTLQIENKENLRIGTLSIHYQDEGYHILHDTEMVKVKQGDSFLMGDLIFNVQFLEFPLQVNNNVMQQQSSDPMNSIECLLNDSHKNDPLAFLYNINKHGDA